LLRGGVTARRRLLARGTTVAGNRVAVVAVAVLTATTAGRILAGIRGYIGVRGRLRRTVGTTGAVQHRIQVVAARRILPRLRQRLAEAICLGGHRRLGNGGRRRHAVAAAVGGAVVQTQTKGAVGGRRTRRGPGAVDRSAVALAAAATHAARRRHRLGDAVRLLRVDAVAVAGRINVVAEAIAVVAVAALFAQTPAVTALHRRTVRGTAIYASSDLSILFKLLV
jgi:hypothetical protein